MTLLLNSFLYCLPLFSFTYVFSVIHMNLDMKLLITSKNLIRISLSFNVFDNKSTCI